MRVFRSLAKFFYVRVSKPILFRQSPDKVHHKMVRTGSVVQKIPLVRSFLKLLRHHSKRLHIKVAGIDFKNPIGLSAGLDKGIELPLIMKNVGFGWMTGGSVTYGKYAGNKGPWFRRLIKDKTLLVNAGLPSEGTEVVADRTAGYSSQMFEDFALNVSVAKTNSKECVSDKAAIEDYCLSLEKFDQLDQVKMLEINISCPNTFCGEPFSDPVRLDKLLTSVDQLGLKKPAFIKMPLVSDWKDFDKLLDVIAKHQITGVVVANLLKDHAKTKLKQDLPADAPGGLSGQPTRDISNQLISRTYKKYGDKLVIIGVGGVFTAEHAYEKICAGASLVALITGLIYEGPQLIGDINYQLEKLLERDGFASVADAVGSKA